MPKRISPKLSPAAKKLTLKGNPVRVDALVRVVGHADYQELAKRITEAGASLRSWNPETNLVTVETPANCLSVLADLDEVVYIEIGSRYQH